MGERLKPLDWRPFVSGDKCVLVKTKRWVLEQGYKKRSDAEEAEQAFGAITLSAHARIEMREGLRPLFTGALVGDPNGCIRQDEASDAVPGVVLTSVRVNGAFSNILLLVDDWFKECEGEIESKPVDYWSKRIAEAVAESLLNQV